MSNESWEYRQPLLWLYFELEPGQCHRRGRAEHQLVNSLRGRDGRKWLRREGDRRDRGYRCEQCDPRSVLLRLLLTDCSGIINVTNITLSEQRISGILGLAFPRLSTLARVSVRSVTSSASASSAIPASSSRYLPPLLETLSTHPYLEYPFSPWHSTKRTPL